MTVAAIHPQAKPLKLGPFQQLRLFANPRGEHEKLRKKYGDLAPIHFQGRTHHLVITPDSAREVFMADPELYDAFWKESFAGMNGEDSLWVLIGEKHRRERLLFAPAVHANHFRVYGEVIRDIARSNFENWRPGQTIKAIDTTLSIALDIIMRLVIGVEDEAVMKEGRKAIHKLTSSAHPLIVFFPKLQRPWFPLWRSYTRAKKELYAWMDSLLAARRARQDESMDVLGALMKSRDEDGNLVSDEHICNELLSILTAGHMTTATALAWILYELGRHSNILEKLRNELEGAGSNADPSSLLRLPYLAAVCNETIRLHPILPECARIPMKSIEIRGHAIPAGDALVISIVGIHHNPDIYPDPDTFNPERFIDRKYSIYEFLPFGSGHRRCLGGSLAEYSMRIALAEAVLHWNFKTAAVDYDIRHDLAMGPKHGVLLDIIGQRTGQ